MKHILLSGALSLLAILLIPTAAKQTQPSAEVQDILLLIETPQQEASQPAEEAQPSVRLLLADGTVETLSMQSYLCAVLLSELPVNFEPEAFAAQAVAARTFTQKRRQTRKHENADVCADSACCQAWQSEESLRARLGAEFDAAMEKAREAVRETDGEVLCYDGELIEATYFSCSGGRTEAAVAVWGSEVPYLQSVESYGEEEALRYSSQAVFRADELSSRLGADFSGSASTWVGAITRTGGGGVDTIALGGKTFQGVELRRLLGLNSTDFTVQADGETLVFSVHGYGHRVGMSQYGANYMARQGFDHRLILTYYYRGAEIEQIASDAA